MAQLTGFQTANETETQTANNGHSIIRQQSWMLDKVKFIITGFGWRKAEIDGKVDKDARLIPVFTTNNNNDLFLSTCVRSRVTADNEILTPSGDFNELVRKEISAGGTDGEILQRIVDKSKDRELQIQRTNYIQLTKDERRVPSSLIEIFFI